MKDLVLRDAPVHEGFKVLEPAVLYARIGTGGMAAVYRGRHFKFDLDVAVKCLKPSLAAENPAYIKRFGREARLAATIAHQNVVRVMDVGEESSLHYLVMEFVTGETVRERVRRKGRLDAEETLAIFHGITAGLAEAHAAGIVHRDIKPTNVLISADGRVKLADLGLAKSTDPIGSGGLSTSVSRIMGTPQYMPPEQWESADVGPAADIWALGATLYFLLAGTAGIPHGTIGSVARRIQDDEYPSLRTARPDLPREIHELLEQCVQRHPRDRFPDAQALLRAVCNLNPGGEHTLVDADSIPGTSQAATATPPTHETLRRIRTLVETGTGAETGAPGRDIQRDLAPDHTDGFTPPVRPDETTHSGESASRTGSELQEELEAARRTKQEVRLQRRAARQQRRSVERDAAQHEKQERLVEREATQRERRKIAQRHLLGMTLKAILVFALAVAVTSPIWGWSWFWGPGSE